MDRITIIFNRFLEKNPDPITELHYKTPFTLLVAVVLSAQATDKSVNKATEKLFAVADTPEQIMALGEENLKQFIRTIGLYNNKAKNIMALCQVLIKKYPDTFPQTRQELEALPGVGRKTANVLLNVAFNHPTIAVDTHIFRVCNRLGIAVGKTPLAIEQTLEKKVPDRFKMYAHHWLILHGRYICKARIPLCHQCFLTDVCDYYQGKK